MKLAREAALDRHLRNGQVRPITRARYRDVDIYLYEGGPHYSKPKEYPHGYYITVFAIGRNGRPQLYQWQEYDGLHDTLYTDTGRFELRINACMKAAKFWIDDSIDVGLFDGPGNQKVRA